MILAIIFISPRTGFFIIVVPSPKSVPMCVDLTGIESGFVMKAGWMKMADTRTTAQRFALLDLLTILKHQYPEAQILGHYQLSATIHKACPCYDPRKEYSGL